MSKTSHVALKFDFPLPGGIAAVRTVVQIAHEKGVAAAREAIMRFDSDIEKANGFMALAICYIQIGQPRMAIKAANIVGGAAFEHQRAAICAAGHYMLGEYGRAREYARTALKHDELDTNSISVLIAASLQLGDPGSANQALNQLFVSRRIDFSGIELARRVHAALGQKFDEAAYITKVAQTLSTKGRAREAHPFYERLKELEPDNPDVLIGLAMGYRGLGDLAGAEASVRAYLAEQESLSAWNMLGLCLTETGRAFDGVNAYRRAAKLAKNPYSVLSNAVMSMHYAPEFSRADILGEIKSCAAHFEDAIRRSGPLGNARRHTPARKRARKRVGFISGHFRMHPAAALSLRGIERLDEDEFELFGYSNSTKTDALTGRFKQRFDHWRNISLVSDAALHDQIVADDLDLLVDLSGNSGGRIFALGHRPAAVQAKWVGGLYNTMGLPCFDWLIADEIQVPKNEEQDFTERVYFMPGNYTVFDPPSHAPQVGPLPAIHNGYITFGCFNNATKINKILVERWARVMSRHKGSKLILKGAGFEPVSTQEFIASWFETAGITRDRVDFRGGTAHRQHLAAYNDVDIALDSWPYTGGLTTCEALWMGCPVVTLPGWTFAGRHAATHLSSIGRENWIAQSDDDLVSIIDALAGDLNALAKEREGLRELCRDSILCDGDRFARNLGTAFRQMISG